MSDTQKTETPAQTLAQQIVKRLVEERLISLVAAKSLQEKLAGGKLRPEDWRLPIELGPDREG